jgi:formate dehydrogenase assembly factor FdhD
MTSIPARENHFFATAPDASDEERGMQITVARQIGERRIEVADTISLEEPLEIKLSYFERGQRHTRSIAVIMRTPAKTRLWPRASSLQGELSMIRHGLRNSRFMLSGRASFEFLQKSVRPGVSMVVAIGAPSSVALRIAQEFDITLVGFVNGEKFNVYHGKERIFPS